MLWVPVCPILSCGNVWNISIPFPEESSFHMILVTLILQNLSRGEDYAHQLNIHNGGKQRDVSLWHQATHPGRADLYPLPPRPSGWEARVKQCLCNPLTLSWLRKRKASTLELSFPPREIWMHGPKLGLSAQNESWESLPYLKVMT